jgi:hypothetical protein
MGAIDRTTPDPDRSRASRRATKVCGTVCKRYPPDGIPEDEMTNGRTLKSVWVLAAAAALAMAVGACSDPTTTKYDPEAHWTPSLTNPDIAVTNVTANSASVDFKTVALGKKATLDIVVENKGAAQMVIPSLATALAGTPFSADIPSEGYILQPAGTQTVKLTFAPVAEDRFELNVQVQVADYPDQALALSLVGVGQKPRFTCDTDTLDFGKRVKGDRQTLDINCTNVSDVDGVLIVSEISGTNASLFRHNYTGNGGRQAVAKGATFPVSVTFYPSGSGPADADLELLSETNADAPERVERVRLKGFTLAHAINCQPTVVNFGFVAPDGYKHAEIVCTNEASEAYNLTNLALDPSSHERFTWLPNTYPITVPAAVGNQAGEARIDVVFHPTLDDSGSRKNGILVITSDDTTTPRIDVQMTGFAGGPVISCSPAQIDFGVVAKGLPTTRSFVCTNAGTDDPASTEDLLVVTGIQATDPAEFSAEVDSPSGQFEAGYAIGSTFTIKVTYSPIDDGVDSAAIQLLSNATNATVEAPYAVTVSGTGRNLPPCDFEIVPQQLRFGIVDKGSSATLEFAVVNHRADAECLVQNLRLAPTCDSAFSLPAGEVTLNVLPPSGELRYPVQFAPREYQSTAFTCEVLFDISNPDTPHQVVPVHGASQEPCALIAPNDLDFGTVKPGCATRDREFQIINTCSSPLILGTIEMNEGVSDEFFIRSTPPVGFAIQPGLSATFTMAYRPEDEGTDTGSVFVNVQNTLEPYMATLRGHAALDATQTDSFEQNERPKVDLLWVIDNSGSMSEEQTAIANNLKPFLSFAQAQQIDYQIGVTTTGLTPASGCPGGANGGEDGRLFPVDNSRPRIITPNTPNMEAVWQANVAVGDCHGTEEGFEAAYRALHDPVIDNCDDPRHPEPNDGNCGFLRTEAHLSIIEVTDEADQSAGTVNFYYNAFLALKGFRNTHLFNYHAITGEKGTGCHSGTGDAEAGDKLIGMVEKTKGGVFQSICAPDWAVSLRAMSAAAFGFQTCFFLGNQPEDTNANGLISDTEGEIEVRMNGHVVASRAPQGQQIWQYSKDQIAVCFNPLSVPEPGTQIDVAYRVACLSW